LFCRFVWDSCYRFSVTHGTNNIIANPTTGGERTVESLAEKDPMEVLAAMGLTEAESRQLMKRIEDERKDQTLRLFVNARKSSTKLRRTMIILWIYSLIVWPYVIAMQLRYPESPRWGFAVWIPVRMDYFSVAAFLFSLILGVFVINWTTGQARDLKKLQELTK